MRNPGGLAVDPILAMVFVILINIEVQLFQKQLAVLSMSYKNFVLNFGLIIKLAVNSSHCLKAGVGSLGYLLNLRLQMIKEIMYVMQLPMGVEYMWLV
jgi:hypothetical protein